MYIVDTQYQHIPRCGVCNSKVSKTDGTPERWYTFRTNSLLSANIIIKAITCCTQRFHLSVLPVNPMRWQAAIFRDECLAMIVHAARTPSVHCRNARCCSHAGVRPSTAMANKRVRSRRRRWRYRTPDGAAKLRRRCN